jgi:protein-tyrosine-phosphatase
MAEALLAAKLRERGADALVHSAGTLPWGGPATGHAVAAVAEHGLELHEHESRPLTAELVEAADLVLGMTRDHVGRVVAHQPAALRKAFLLGEAVRLGKVVGPRAADEPVAEWVAELSSLRPRERPPGRAADEVADPAGESLDVYRRTAARLDRMTTSLAELLVP